MMRLSRGARDRNFADFDASEHHTFGNLISVIFRQHSLEVFDRRRLQVLLLLLNLHDIIFGASFAIFCLFLRLRFCGALNFYSSSVGSVLTSSSFLPRDSVLLTLHRHFNIARHSPAAKPSGGH